ncbi:amidase family protein [Methylocapsa sp. S129]|uniref:amidase family protein n=1 Tax=Methylocapsa sp. S129 TaxID=1641869 RepID=UPI00131BFC8E|nr:amidase family protein [Methylocapsa sp. S129]
MDDLLLLPATRLREKLRAREISTVELTQASLARIDAVNPALNALIALDPQAALTAAAESDQRLARGEGRALEGLPVSVKDAFNVAGFTASAGAPALKERRPEADAPAVARLRAAGAIILGKSNTPVFASDFQTYNPIYGVTNHPRDPAFSPGGSSGGAAAAIASGMSALELGSDLGGSLRWPAHACGIFGHKSTWGLVSTHGSVPPPPHKILLRDADCLVAGPLGRSAEDLALMLDVIAGPRVGPRRTALKPARRREAKGLRVALWANDPFAATDSSVRAAVEEAARRLAALGAEIDETARPGFSFAEAFELFALYNHGIIAYGLPVKLRNRLAATVSQYAKGGLSHQALQARGAWLTPGDYRDMELRRRALQRHWARFFERFDIVLCPPAPVGAIRHDHRPDVHQRTLDVDGIARPYLDFLHWSALSSGPGLPATAAPVGLGPDGMPRGVQIIAAMDEDLTAIAAAAMIAPSAAPRP